MDDELGNRRKKLDERRLELIAHIGRRIKVPRMFAELALEGIEDVEKPNPEYRDVVNQIWDLGEYCATLQFREDPIFYLMVGNFGLGKTRFATFLIVRAYLAMKDKFPMYEHRAPLFISAADLVEARFGKDDEDVEEGTISVRDWAEKSPFVVIDDVNRLPGYKGEQSFLERVIEKRINANLSTILTASEDITEKSGRFANFISYFEWLIFTGDSFRKTLGG